MRLNWHFSNLSREIKLTAPDAKNHLVSPKIFLILHGDLKEKYVTNVKIISEEVWLFIT